MKPSISIVVPSYNQACFLAHCLKSIHDQNYPNLEVIVMDGGSTDGSLEIIKRNAQMLTYWQSRTDGGQTSAIAAGFEHASGNLLTWLNSDDVLLSGALEKHAKAYARAQNADVFYGDHYVIDANGKVVEKYKHPPYYNKLAWLTMPYIAQPGTLFTRKIWDSVGGVDLNMQCAFDYDLWYRFMQMQARFIHVGGAVAAFRIHKESKGANWLEVYEAEHRLLRQRYATKWGNRWERTVARLLLFTVQGLSGAYLYSLVYRAIAQRRFRRYTHSSRFIS